VKFIHPVANLPLASRHRVSRISFHPTQSYVAVQSHDRSVEIFRIRTEEEVRKKQARRKKRAQEKKKQGKAVEEKPDDDDSEIALVDMFTPHLVLRTSGKIKSFDYGTDEKAAKPDIQVSSWSYFRALELTIF
jgi:U3 small nucleolar RNA-associated protein 12